MWALFLCIPLTTKIKDTSYYYKLGSVTFIWKESRLIISQPKALDKKRFLEKIGVVSVWEFGEIKKLLRNFYFPEA